MRFLNLRYILTILLLIIATSSYSQATNPDNFEKFAKNLDSVMIKHYEKLDTNGYNSTLQVFFDGYDNLDTLNKKKYNFYAINAFYNRACLYSLLDKKEAAIKSLERSVELGLLDYNHLKNDPDLNNIRNTQAYITVEQYLRGIKDYKYILQIAGKYDYTDKRKLPKFEYQQKEASELLNLRKKYNLDNIAGDAGEVTQIINLMRWVHDNIKHDGGVNGKMTSNNAQSLITKCINENSGLNCRGLATILNEFYLSMGFHSRIVTCLPKDSLGIDDDCHVINAVYSYTLKKWIWMDPTNNAYVMNEKGELLSIQEVRSKIINNEMLILNPDANWNNKERTTKNQYLYYYMAKNLYKLKCPVVSQYNMEKPLVGKTIEYIELLPVAYFKQKPDKEIITNHHSGVTYTTYKTNNPDLFWMMPE